MGYDFLHVAIDDATRLAYVEVLPDEKRWSTTGFLIRALRWFKERGVRVERVMTDKRLGLHRQALPQGVADAWHPAHPDTPIHPEDKW